MSNFLVLKNLKFGNILEWTDPPVEEEEGEAEQSE